MDCTGIGLRPPLPRRESMVEERKAAGVSPDTCETYEENIGLKTFRTTCCVAGVCIVFDVCSVAVEANEAGRPARGVQKPRGPCVCARNNAVNTGKRSVQCGVLVATRRSWGWALRRHCRGHVGAKYFV